MKNKIILTLVSFLFAASSCFGYGTGISSHPLSEGKKVITTEFVGNVSNGKGMGIQVKYFKKLNEKIGFDTGIGFSDGSRSNRIFLSSDMEFFPDYGKQPRVSLKGTLENAKEFGNRRNIISVAPTVSKGFSVWGKEIFPFFSAPVGLVLDTKDKNYRFRSDVALGLTGKLETYSMARMIYNIEGNVNLTNGFSAVYLGFSYLIN